MDDGVDKSEQLMQWKNNCETLRLNELVGIVHMLLHFVRLPTYINFRHAHVSTSVLGCLPLEPNVLFVCMMNVIQCKSMYSTRSIHKCFGRLFGETTGTARDQRRASGNEICGRHPCAARGQSQGRPIVDEVLGWLIVSTGMMKSR